MGAEICEKTKAEFCWVGAEYDSSHGQTFVLWPGVRPPLHCLHGHQYFSTCRASGEMNCPSQSFSIPLQHTVKSGHSMAMMWY